MSKFEIGDMVVLISGSMRMAVESFEDEAVSVVWCHEGKVGRDTFHEALLNKWEARENERGGDRGGFGGRGGDRGGFNKGGDRGGWNKGGDRGDRGGDRGGWNKGGDRGDRGGWNKGGDRGDRPQRGGWDDRGGDRGYDGRPREKKYFRSNDE
ncbi:hypothetical protein ACQ5SO_04010 [Rhodovulum sp. DZ06]|uniref:hypothetical protein n=1 Tax=Rhodovulum sp. DZ06 TaxID=3425126 RepID=UPI003D327E5B